ncbi:MAG TPA: hypothetical protein VNM24_12135 [Burkholderiales bacterium]|jgi:hypothetical protein|nr:hypothetical protein [Burkholderiales bacterium]
MGALRNGCSSQSRCYDVRDGCVLRWKPWKEFLAALAGGSARQRRSQLDKPKNHHEPDYDD